MNLHRQYAGKALGELLNAPFAHPKTLNKVLWWLAKWRSETLAAEQMRRSGLVVQSGPFQGMNYLDYVTQGGFLPRLLGVYEFELQEHLRGFLSRGARRFVDIGSAEGYYAVGVARFAPATTVYAYDIDPSAREACRELAKRNDVSERVIIGETFTGDMFAEHVGQDALIFMDAEGYEDELLDPNLWPALRELSCIVECHPGYKPGVTERLQQRFSLTHDVELVEQRPMAAPLPPWIKGQPFLDQLLALWDDRSSPTPWLIMRPRVQTGR